MTYQKVSNLLLLWQFIKIKEAPLPNNIVFMSITVWNHKCCMLVWHEQNTNHKLLSVKVIVINHTPAVCIITHIRVVSMSVQHIVYQKENKNTTMEWNPVLLNLARLFNIRVRETWTYAVSIQSSMRIHRNYGNYKFNI